MMLKKIPFTILVSLLIFVKLSTTAVAADLVLIVDTERTIKDMNITLDGVSFEPALTDRDRNKRIYKIRKEDVFDSNKHYIKVKLELTLKEPKSFIPPFLSYGEAYEMTHSFNIFNNSQDAELSLKIPAEFIINMHKCLGKSAYESNSLTRDLYYAGITYWKYLFYNCEGRKQEALNHWYQISKLQKENNPQLMAFDHDLFQQLENKYCLLEADKNSSGYNNLANYMMLEVSQAKTDFWKSFIGQENTTVNSYINQLYGIFEALKPIAESPEKSSVCNTLKLFKNNSIQPSQNKSHLKSLIIQGIRYTDILAIKQNVIRI